MHIEITDNLPAVKFYQYPFNEKKQEFIAAEIKTLLAKSVIVETKHEPGELISPIFVREKPAGVFCLILNLKRLNKIIEYKKFKLETIFTILDLARPGMYIGKLDIKDAYYGVPIFEDIFEVSVPNHLVQIYFLTQWIYRRTKEIYKTLETSFGILKKN